MDYAQQNRDPTRHLIGITVVVLLHVVLVYALVNGLARKIVDVIKDPLSVKLIQEIKPPPPPPPPPKVVTPPPPKAVLPPPPVYVPPPEVVVDRPPPPPQVAVTTTAAPPPVEIPPPPAPPAQVVKAAPPAIVQVGVICPNWPDVRSNVEYPAQAQRKNITGDVVVEFSVDASGAVKDINIVRSANKIFNGAVTAAISRLQCEGQGQPQRVAATFSFKTI